MVANVSNDLYRFACQVRAGDQVDVRTIRCVDVKEAIAFAERLAQCPLTDTAFSEIHKLQGFGGVQVVWSDKEKVWPTDAKIVAHDVVFAPKPKHVFTGNAAKDKATANVPFADSKPVVASGINTVNDKTPSEKLMDKETIVFCGLQMYWRKVA